ncbi:AAA family ATPase [Bradyrhizobium ottawaense]|uniref:AAA family ATPase n=1 Tax=Bradyrhizobium ottawaense TaxID=931866 RepID=UPI003516F9D4
MRLRRLDLTRYGKFTDHSIDFGERPIDQPDLHVIYGPNEAGKSTAFTGVSRLVVRNRDAESVRFPPPLFHHADWRSAGVRR